ncbi:MAG: GNAT family N-acetyltransferase, partial [Magnetococcales bacterium]|nr:GNAT family N-acetyltransferase [Magnetococcales bacterium]
MAAWHLTECAAEAWQLHWRHALQGSLWQSWEYGTALCQTRQCRPRRFLIQDEQGCVRGVVQFLVWSLPGLGGVARLNGGPAAVATPWSLTEQDLFLRALQSTARRQRWWYVRAAFGWSEAAELHPLLQKHGFQPLPQRAAWGSHRLSLQPDVAALRRNLAGKWRNLLGKGERLGMRVQTGIDAERWWQLHACYRAFQQEKGFTGIAPALLGRLLAQNNPSWQIHLFSAHAPSPQKELLGLLVTIHHGTTATYLIGWTAGEGRRWQAGYLLLWQAIVLAKSQGLAWFDLGGVNEETTAGIRHFKRGVGGLPYQWVGEWRWR